MSQRIAHLDPRWSVRILAVIVIFTTLSSLVTIAFIASSTRSSVVQGAEVDLAGRQRRLSERIAYDVSVLQANPDRSDIRDELVRTVSELHDIHAGLLGGNVELGLDGRLPDTARRLYSPQGLDLSARLDRYEAAAANIAATPGSPRIADLAAIETEAVSERVVRDLDQVVESLSTAQAAHTSTRIRRSFLGLAASVVLGLASVGSLISIRRRLRRQLAARAVLVGEIAASEELYRTTVNTLVDGVAILDDEGRIVEINDSARQLIEDMAPGDLPSSGEHFYTFLPRVLSEEGTPLAPEDRLFLRALRDPDPIVGLIVALSLRDGMHWYRVNAAATAPVNGRRRRVVVTFADITTERVMATRLRDQDRQFRLALEHAPIGMALVSLGGDFMSVNSALCHLTGYAHDELLHIGPFALAHPDDPPFDRADLAALASGDTDVVFSARRLVTRDGSAVDVDVAMSVVRSDSGSDPHFIVDYLDISESVRADQAQRAALAREQDMVAKLLELDNTRTTFVTTVSHELRTPLTSLIGYLEMLADETAGPINEDQRRMVDAASRNGHRLCHLIDDLLTLTTADRQQTPDRSRPIEMSTLLDGVMETMVPIANVAGVALSLDIGTDRAEVLGSTSELERVMINIVGNAIKFTPARGRVGITMRLVGADRSQVEISVTDTGVGIPEHEHDHLFTRFFRSSSAQANHVPGTGLGLAIAARLVESHDGHITLASAEGTGTTVTIRFPQRSPAFS